MVVVSTEACEQEQLGNVGGKEVFVGEFSERDLDRQITRLARQKVIKLVPEGAASELQVRRPHIKKKEVELQTFSVPRGCPGCTVVLAGTGPYSHSAECRTRMEQLTRGDVGEEAQTAFRRLRRRWKTKYQLFWIRNEMCECDTPDKRMEEADKASSSHEPKMIRLMKKRGQVRRVGDSRLEDHDVAVKEIAQI